MIEIELYVTNITLCDKVSNEIKNLKEYQRISFKDCLLIAKQQNSVLVSKKTSKQKFTINPNHLEQGN